jgi:hypothetical protein
MDKDLSIEELQELYNIIFNGTQEEIQQLILSDGPSDSVKWNTTFWGRIISNKVVRAQRWDLLNSILEKGCNVNIYGLINELKRCETFTSQILYKYIHIRKLVYEIISLFEKNIEEARLTDPKSFRASSHSLYYKCVFLKGLIDDLDKDKLKIQNILINNTKLPEDLIRYEIIKYI